MKRLTIHMREGGPHVLDFDTDEQATAALAEVNTALRGHGPALVMPVTIAGRVVVRPADVRSAELTDPPALIA